MRRFFAAGVFGLCACAPAAQASAIQTACLQAGRAEASAEMCACIQAAADFTLGEADQRLIARFFADPEQAQDIKRSDTPRNEAFWARYTDFGNAAEALCAPERE